jgi:hypothetical protein
MTTDSLVSHFVETTVEAIVASIDSQSVGSVLELTVVLVIVVSFAGLLIFYFFVVLVFEMAFETTSLSRH